MSDIKRFWLKVTTGSGFPFWETEITDNEELKNQYDDFNSSVCVVLESQLLAEQEKVRKLKEALIFYSNDEKYEEEFNQLDWSLVNNGAAIQDKGKFARQTLKEVEGV